MVHGVIFVKGKFVVTNYNSPEEVPYLEQVVYPEELQSYLEEAIKKRG